MHNSAEKLISTWRQCAEAYDDIVSAESSLLYEVVDSKEQLNRIKQLTAYFQEFKSFAPNFFDHFNFEWCLYAESFNTAMEAELTGRIMHMLHPFWVNRIDWVLDLKLNIAVRYAISPKISGISPKAFKFEQYDFIVYPIRSASSWFYQMLDLISIGKDHNTHMMLRNYLLKLITDDFMQSSIFEQNLYYLKPMEIFSLGTLLAIEVKENIRFFVKSQEHSPYFGFLDKFWDDSSYLSTNFALAHELAHILKNEHFKNSGVNELHTDQLALSILKNANFYRESLHSSKLLNKSYIPEFSFWMLLEHLCFQTETENLISSSSYKIMSEMTQRKAISESSFIHYGITSINIYSDVKNYLKLLNNARNECVKQVLQYKNQIVQIGNDLVKKL